MLCLSGLNTLSVRQNRGPPKSGDVHAGFSFTPTPQKGSPQKHTHTHSILFMFICSLKPAQKKKTTVTNALVRLQDLNQAPTARGHFQHRGLLQWPSHRRTVFGGLGRGCSAPTTLPPDMEHDIRGHRWRFGKIDIWPSIFNQAHLKRTPMSRPGAFTCYFDAMGTSEFPPQKPLDRSPYGLRLEGTS